MNQQTFRVVIDAWINGGFRASGGTIRMTPAEAKYWLLAGTLEQIVTAAPSPSARESKPSRKAVARE